MPAKPSRNHNDGSSKIKPLRELANIVTGLKRQAKQVVHCHGVFDLMHPGHIRHLKAAKQQGDVLILTITPDHFVRKGPGRPVFNQALRAESLASLSFVDYVSINEWPTAVEAIHLLKPSVYVKGSDYASPKNDATGKIVDEARAVKSVGGKIHFTDEITYSSSNLINSLLSVFPTETEAWLQSFRKRYSPDDVLGYLKKAASLKVLVVGEAIVDEYVFCDGLGKSSKDPILAFQYRSMEAHAGGSLAVANHLAGFCEQVGLITFLGDTDRREDFVRKALRPNVRTHLLTQHQAPTIHKRRFVDSHTNAKMFELYVMRDDPLSDEDEKTILKCFEKEMGRYDLIVAVDYGHGLFTPSLIRKLCRSKRFLAVNTQANAGNRGFNTISKYPRADYICLTGQEVALETRMRHADWRELVAEATKRIDCPQFAVTHGKEGILHYLRGGKFTEAPALATNVKDRVGAGDAVLAITSLLAYQKAPGEIIGFVGNLAGAEMVAQLGNRISIDRTMITKDVTSLMK